MMLVSPKTAGGHDDTPSFPRQRDALPASLRDITGACVLRDLFETCSRLGRIARTEHVLSPRFNKKPPANRRLTSHRPDGRRRCCPKASVGFQFPQPRAILLTVHRDGSSVRAADWYSPSTAGVRTMRNHDFVSDGFLAVTAASLVLLCSGLLAIAFA